MMSLSENVMPLALDCGDANVVINSSSHTRESFLKNIKNRYDGRFFILYRDKLIDGDV